MKILRLVSLVLVLSMITCVFFSCNSSDSDDLDIAIPQRDMYTVKVSFQIKDPTGKTQVEAIDYTYKGHAEPTIMNVMQAYLSIEADWVFKLDKENSITQIGGMKADKKNGDYWGFVSNVSGQLTDELKEKRNGNEDKKIAPEALTAEEIASCYSVKDTAAINLSIDQIKKGLGDGSLKDAFLVDGAQFTVMLIKSSEE